MLNEKGREELHPDSEGGVNRAEAWSIPGDCEWWALADLLPNAAFLDALLYPLPALARRYAFSLDRLCFDMLVMAFGVYEKHSAQATKLTVL